MRSPWASVIVMMGLAAAPAGCGPAVDPPSDEGGSTAPNGTTDTGEPATADASASGGASTAASSTVDDTADEATAEESSSGGVVELVPPDSVITTVLCNDDGTLNLVVEVILIVGTQDCAPPADVDPGGVLLLSIPAWNSLPGVYEVGPRGPAQAAIGTYALEGTLELEVWAPTHPSIATFELSGPSGGIVGFVDLQHCTVVNEECPPPDGG